MSGRSQDAAAAKSWLRREIRTTLTGLSQDARRTAAMTARTRIGDLAERSQAHIVLAYLSDGLEVDLDPTIESLLDRGGTVAVPVVMAERGRMAPARITTLDPTAMIRDRYDLRSPREPLDLIALDRLDLVIVPGVAFTTEGHRLGRGGGYYDRLLRDLPGGVRRVGVCHACQVVPSLPTESHDVTIDDLIVV